MSGLKQDEEVLEIRWGEDPGILTEDNQGRRWFYAMTTEQLLEMQQKLHQVEINHLQQSGFVEITEMPMSEDSPYAVLFGQKKL